VIFDDESHRGDASQNRRLPTYDVNGQAHKIICFEVTFYMTVK